MDVKIVEAIYRVSITRRLKGESLDFCRLSRVWVWMGMGMGMGVFARELK